MPSSKRFRQLQRELRRLRRHFLPQEWDDTGTYNDRKLDRARAYKILAHAEIEFYIENMSFDVVNLRYQEWVSAKKPSLVVIYLLAASKTGWQDSETDDLGMSQLDVSQMKIKRDDESIDKLIERSFLQYRTIVEDNHGIKQTNLKRLLMPLGIALSDLDRTWLNNMESFGSTRGFVAHTSRIGVKNPPDPKTEKTTVDVLLTGLETLDGMILGLLK